MDVVGGSCGRIGPGLAGARGHGEMGGQSRGSLLIGDGADTTARMHVGKKKLSGKSSQIGAERAGDGAAEYGGHRVTREKKVHPERERERESGISEICVRLDVQI